MSYLFDSKEIVSTPHSGNNIQLNEVIQCKSGNSISYYIVKGLRNANQIYDNDRIQCKLARRNPEKKIYEENATSSSFSYFKESDIKSIFRDGNWIELSTFIS